LADELHGLGRPVPEPNAESGSMVARIHLVSAAKE
jgi:hypothetical protein